MGTRRIEKSGRARRLVQFATSCVWLAGCQSPPPLPPPPPPFTVPQPTADWSDPERQGKATIEVLSCDLIRATREQGCWSLDINARIVANSQETAWAVAEAICWSFAGIAPHVATLRESAGPTIQLSEPYRARATTRRPKRLIDYAHPDYPPKQVSTGEWSIETPARFITKELPTRAVELAIDGEAMRKALIRKASPGSELHAIPVGGLTGTTSVFIVPAPKPETPDAPPTSGAGIAPPSNIAPHLNR